MGDKLLLTQQELSQLRSDSTRDNRQLRSDIMARIADFHKKKDCDDGVKF